MLCLFGGAAHASTPLSGLLDVRDVRELFGLAPEATEVGPADVDALYATLGVTAADGARLAATWSTRLTPEGDLNHGWVRDAATEARLTACGLDTWNHGRTLTPTAYLRYLSVVFDPDWQCADAPVATWSMAKKHMLMHQTVLHRVRTFGPWSQTDTRAALHRRTLVNRASLDHVGRVLGVPGGSPLHDRVVTVEDIAEMFEVPGGWARSAWEQIYNVSRRAFDQPETASVAMANHVTGPPLLEHVYGVRAFVRGASFCWTGACWVGGPFQYQYDDVLYGSIDAYLSANGRPWTGRLGPPLPEEEFIEAVEAVVGWTWDPLTGVASPRGRDGVLTAFELQEFFLELGGALPSGRNNPTSDILLPLDVETMRYDTRLSDNVEMDFMEGVIRYIDFEL